MTAEHRRVREQLAAYALGAEVDRAAVRAHLEGCADCRAELAELARVTDRLRLVDGPAPAPAAPPEDVAERLFGRLALARRRARLRAGAVTTAAAVVGALAVTVLPREATPDLPPARPVAFTVAPEGVTASAELRDWGWGTQMVLDVEGLPRDERLAVWLEQPDGSRVPAGSFTTTGGDLTMWLGAGIPTEDAVALGASAADGTTVLRAPLSGDDHG